MVPTDNDSREAQRARHRALTQLEVSSTLRSYQRQWFADLRRNVIQDRVPYVLCGALAPHEVFDCLGMPYITNVWYSGLVAARRQSAYYATVLGQRGFHDGLDKYGALALAVALDQENQDPPWGGLPRPALLTTIGAGGDRMWEVMAELWRVPYVSVHLPVLQTLYPNWWELSAWAGEDLDGRERVDVVAAGIREVILHAEQITGKRLDVDQLRAVVERVNEQEGYFDEVRRIICEAPKLPVRLGEVMSQVMGIQWHRGSEWALGQARSFRDEVKARADQGQWVCPHERYRLMWVGVGLWQNLDFFTEFEESHGAVFARSMYLSIAIDGYVRLGFHDPVRALAARYGAFSEHLHVAPYAPAWHLHEARRFRIDGAVMIKAGGARKFIAQALEENGIPVLELDVDAVDERTWDEERIHREVQRFIESRVANRKYTV